MISLLKSLIFCLFLFLGLPAFALLRSDYDMSLGFTSLGVNIGTGFSRTLESFSTLEFNYNLNVSGPELALTLSFHEVLNSEFGEIPIARLGLGARWYPLGLNGYRQIYANQVSGRVWKPSPFIGLSLGATNISVKDPVDSDYFNASLFDAMIKVGTEIPITFDWMLLGQYAYLTSFGGTAESSSENVNYSGSIMLVGIKMTNW